MERLPEKHRSAAPNKGNNLLDACDGFSQNPLACHPGRPWSLWDMLCNLKIFVTALEDLRHRRESICALPIDDELSRIEEMSLATTFFNWQLLAKEFDLPTCLATTEKIIGRFDKSRIGTTTFLKPLTARTAVGRIDEFEENFRYDTRVRGMFLMGRDRLAHFNGGFDPTVENAFQSALPEIREANTCYALERYTATAFHCMRAVEYALRALAVAVGAPPQKLPLEYEEWNKLIELVDCYWKVAVDQWGNSAEQINARRFFKRIVADLQAFKDDVRNVTMHTRGDYDGPGALSVINRVRDWFVVLSEKANDNMTSGQLLDRTLFS